MKPFEAYTPVQRDYLEKLVDASLQAARCRAFGGDLGGPDDSFGMRYFCGQDHERNAEGHEYVARKAARDLLMELTRD